LLFDECFLGQLNIERELKPSLALFGGDAELAHLFNKFSPGTEDHEWIPSIAREGWIVISADRGVNSKVSEKLPLICREFGVTHVIASASLQKRPAYFKIEAITSSWPVLLGEVATSTRGTGYLLQIVIGKKQRISYMLRKTYEPTADGPEA
jgi:hypothetical protein